MIPHTRALEAAYQLHFYLCLKTKYNLPLLSRPGIHNVLIDRLGEVCQREKYHLLESDISPNHLRLLLSLQPADSISLVTQRLKGNLDHAFRKYCPDELRLQKTTKLWSRGHFARSSGKVCIERAQSYVDSQVRHHGYKGEWTEALNYKNPKFKSPMFELEHCVCNLDYHLVFATAYRNLIFDEAMAPGLFSYIERIGEKHGFAIDRIGLLPDHIHLILEAIPSLSVEACALAIINNTRYWVNQNYPGVLKLTKAWDVWAPSYYAGTIGEYTTAQMKQFLASRA